MRITLLHNPSAGHNGLSRETLVDMLRQAGHQPMYQSADDPAFPEALKDPADLVLVAGGDGTVRKAVMHLVDRAVPIAVLPTGTANNIALMLGIEGAPEALIAGLDRVRRRRYDVGQVQTPWGEQWFIEGVGVGPLPEMMAGLSARKKQVARVVDSAADELDHARRFLIEVLSDYPARSWHVTLDGKDHSGRYLLLEALNGSTVGPNVQLAPAAHTGDGFLDVVMLPEEERRRLIAYLERCLDGADVPFDGTVYQCRSVRIALEDARLHVDDKLYPKGPDDAIRPGDIDIQVGEHSVEFLVPEGTDGEPGNDRVPS